MENEIKKTLLEATIFLDLLNRLETNSDIDPSTVEIDKKIF